MLLCDRLSPWLCRLESSTPNSAQLLAASFRSGSVGATFFQFFECIQVVSSDTQTATTSSATCNSTYLRGTGRSYSYELLLVVGGAHDHESTRREGHSTYRT